MTLQDLTNNRDRIIRNIQFQMSGDSAARKQMVIPIMTKMVAFLNNAKYSEMKPTMANIDKLTKSATESWIKYDYNPGSTMTTSEVNAFEIKREEAKYSSIS
jgi:hypothetical protein